MIVHGDGRRLHGDGGTALVEAALLGPLVFMLFLGVLEGGLAMLNYLSVSNAASGGVRMAGIAGSDIGADHAIINAIRGEGSAIKREDITRIVVYKATGSTSTVPTACANATIGVTGTNPCNVYLASDLDDALTSPTFRCGTSAKDRFWCPTTRKDALEGTNGPPDWIGVYIELEHPLVTGMFGDTFTITADVVTRIEPSSLR